MIGKIVKGRGFRGLVRYLTDGGRGRFLFSDHLSTDDPDEAAREMQIAAAMSARTTKPLMHIVIAYEPGQKPSPEQMAADGRRVLKALGMSENQAIAFAHEDTGHPHFHLAVNRVGPGGKAVSDSNSFAKIERVLRQIEQERGWAPVPGRNAPAPQSGRRHDGPRRSRDPRQHAVPASIKNTLLTAQNWKALHAGLAAEGWRVEIVQRQRGRGLLLIGPAGQKVGAGQVDRAATLTRLTSRLGQDPAARRSEYQKQAGRALATAGLTLAGAALAPFLGVGFQPAYTPRPRRPRRAPSRPRL